MVRRWIALPPLLLALSCGAGAHPTPPTVEVAPAASAEAPAQPVALDAACARGTGHLLAALRAEMEVTAFVTKGSPQLDAFVKTLDEVLTGYERLAPGKFRHRIVEASTPELKQTAKDAGLQERVLGGEGQTMELRRGFLGLSLRYRGESETIPFFDPGQAWTLRFWLANKIREVRDRADDTAQHVAIVTGKDEIKISDANLIAAGNRGPGPTLKGIMESALPFYKLDGIDLQDGSVEIDPSAAGLIITQPGRDFTEKELRRIDQFLMRGKSVVVFAGAVNLKPSDAAMTAQLGTHGLEKLLDGYGIELRKDAVFDWERPAPVKVDTQGAPVTFAYPATVLARHDPAAGEPNQPLDQTFPAFFLLDELVFPFPSTLVPHPERQPGATLHVVARTSPKATAVTSATVDMKPRRTLAPTGEQAQRALAVALEGKIHSAFAGKPDPAIPAPADSTGRGRLLVVSSSQFLANPWARAGNPPPVPPQMAMMGALPGDEELLTIANPYAQTYLTATILAFKNTLDWMSSDEDLIACSALLAHK